MHVKDDRANLAVLNILVLTIVGIGASSWVLFYTDYFPVVTGLLGLGGMFAWVAFLLNVLPSERKTSIQTLFDRHCLQNRGFLIALGGIPVLAALIFAPARGTLLIDNLEAKESRVVKVYPLGPNRKPLKKKGWRVPVAAGSQVKILLRTPWLGSREYYVQPSGLPAARLIVQSLSRETIDMPYRFTEQPALLVRADASCFLKYAKVEPGGEGSLTIQVLESDGPQGAPREIANEPFSGAPAWIGCDKNVVIPQTVVDRWRLEIALAKFDEREVVNWLTPIALAPETELRVGSTIIINVLRLDKTTWFSTSVKVPLEVKQFPKEVVLQCPEAE